MRVIILKLFSKLLILLILLLTFINCDDNVKELKESDIVNLWSFTSSNVSRSVSYNGQAIYYFTGLTGIIYDTVTVDTLIRSSEEQILSGDSNYLNLAADKTYQLVLTDTNSITMNDSGSWEFDENKSSLTLSSSLDTTYNLFLDGSNKLNTVLINETISYDTLIRVENVAVQCKALGTISRIFSVE